MGYDPDQPRDDHGRWGEGGQANEARGGHGESVQPAKAGPVRVDSPQDLKAAIKDDHYYQVTDVEMRSGGRGLTSRPDTMVSIKMVETKSLAVTRRFDLRGKAMDKVASTAMGHRSRDPDDEGGYTAWPGSYLKSKL